MQTRKIIIETSCLANKYTGISKTIRALLHELKTLGFIVEEVSPLLCGKRAGYSYFNIFLPSYCKKHLGREDIFIIPNNLGKFWRLPHSNTWVIMHDLIPLTEFGYSGIRRLLYRYKLTKLKQASKIITISEYVKKQLHDKLRVPYELIEVLYWSKPKTESSFKPNYTDKYFLSIGTGEPRKNINSLISFWRNLCDEPYKLYLYGTEWKKGTHRELISIIKSYNLENRIKLLGKVEENELDGLYAGAVGFIFPSLEEGFGLPPLEALANGCSVILPKTPINYELYSNVGYFYSVGINDELRNCIKDVIENRDTIRNIEASDKFNMDNFRNNLLRIFNK